MYANWASRIGRLVLQNKGRSSLLLVPFAFCAVDCPPVEPAKANCKNNWRKAKSVYEFTYVDIDGCTQSMEKYKGKVLIIVNVATECDRTRTNYEQLVALHQKFGQTEGLAILAFPCNQFGKQEPGTEEEIKKSIEPYGVQFDMASKVEVNGENAHPIFKYLKDKNGGWWWFITSSISWNFGKFLVDRQGLCVDRFTPEQEPYDVYRVICKNDWYIPKPKKSKDPDLDNLEGKCTKEREKEKQKAAAPAPVPDKGQGQGQCKPKPKTC